MIGAVPPLLCLKVVNMPRILPDSLINEAIELYKTTQSFQETAAILGKNPESLRVALRRRGVEAIPRTGRVSKKRIAAPADLKERHEVGDSVLSLSERYGVSRRVVDRWLTEAGLQRRTASEAGVIRWQRMSEEEMEMRRAQARQRFTGRKLTSEQRLKRAQTRAAQAAEGTLRRSYLEALFGGWLHDRGIQYVPEAVVTEYNVDFRVGPVAVELLW